MNKQFLNKAAEYAEGGLVTDKYEDIRRTCERVKSDMCDRIEREAMRDDSSLVTTLWQLSDEAQAWPDMTYQEYQTAQSSGKPAARWREYGGKYYLTLENGENIGAIGKFRDEPVWRGMFGRKAGQTMGGGIFAYAMPFFYISDTVKFIEVKANAKYCITGPRPMQMLPAITGWAKACQWMGRA